MCRAIAVIGLLLGTTLNAAQGPELNAVMRRKLDETQKILEAVVKSDWVSLETHSRALEQLANDPRWTTLRYPEYAQHSAAFLRAIQQLRQAAMKRDLDRTPTAYADLTFTCVACHRYLARVRLAH
jgi:hypothetical protein